MMEENLEKDQDTAAFDYDRLVKAIEEHRSDLAAALTVKYWMEWRKKGEGGGIPEPPIRDKESGLAFENLYQYHAYWWGRDSLDGANRRVGEFQKKLVKALESICFDADERRANKQQVAGDDE